MKKFVNFKELDRIIDEYKDDPIQKAGILVLKSSTKKVYKDKEIPLNVAQRVMTNMKSNAELLASSFADDDEDDLFDAFMESAESYGKVVSIVFRDDDED